MNAKQSEITEEALAALSAEMAHGEQMIRQEEQRRDFARNCAERMAQRLPGKQPDDACQLYRPDQLARINVMVET